MNDENTLTTPTVPGAFHESCDAPAMQLPRPLNFDQLSEIIRKTAAVMSQPPVKKKGWKTSVQNLAQQAHASGDLDMHSFLYAVIALIERGTSAFGELTASVPESYQDVWNALGILLHQPIKPDAC